MQFVFCASASLSEAFVWSYHCCFTYSRCCITVSKSFTKLQLQKFGFTELKVPTLQVVVGHTVCYTPKTDYYI